MQDLQRFLPAQETMYDIALGEIRKGKKLSHWMWFIFPQVKGLALSQTAGFYAISDLEEAEAYLDHPVLGKRLLEISAALFSLPENDAHKILGFPDDMKLKSCMTLFNCVEPGTVFQRVLDKFFDGKLDDKTLAILGK